MLDQLSCEQARGNPQAEDDAHYDELHDIRDSGALEDELSDNADKGDSGDVDEGQRDRGQAL